MDEIENKLEHCLRVHLRRLGPEQAIDPAADLMQLGLDSMSSIDLLMDMEKTFGVTFPDTMLSRETFQNTATLGAAIRQLRAAGGTSVG